MEENSNLHNHTKQLVADHSKSLLENAIKFENVLQSYTELSCEYIDLHHNHSATLQICLDEIAKHAGDSTARAFLITVTSQVLTNAGNKILENIFTYYSPK